MITKEYKINLSPLSNSHFLTHPPKMTEPSLSEVLLQLEELRKEVAALKQTKKQPCQGVTGKGTPCRNGALPGTSHCRMHSREPKEPKAPKPKKDPKPKKTIPEHNHPIDSPDPTCALCNTHGDCMDPSLPDH